MLVKDPDGLRFLEQLRKVPCYAGLDLAAVSDLTVFVLAWPIKDKVYVYPWFFIPGDGLAERVRNDGVPYTTWSQEGHVELTEGSTTDWRYVVGRIKELAGYFKIKEVGFDNWGARDVVRELGDGGITCIDVSQSIGSLSAPTKRLQELILDKKLVHTGHPILRWNLDCTTIWSDSNGNIKVQKPELGKSTKRIDGVVATIMALSRIQKTETPFKSVYSTRGLRTL
jgi:phage terminase large subunit-like protein